MKAGSEQVTKPTTLNMKQYLKCILAHTRWFKSVGGQIFSLSHARVLFQAHFLL
jgi:hypothetical protein